MKTTDSPKNSSISDINGFSVLSEGSRPSLISKGPSLCANDRELNSLIRSNAAKCLELFSGPLMHRCYFESRDQRAAK